MTEKATLQRDAERQYRVVGPMTVATLPQLWPGLERAVRTPGVLEISLASVTRVDSAAAAALVACTRLARESRAQLHFADLPESMRVIIEVSDLDDLFVGNAKPD